MSLAATAGFGSSIEGADGHQMGCLPEGFLLVLLKL